MTTRPLRHRTPHRSGAAPRPDAHDGMAAAFTPALPKAAAARLARLNATDIPWLRQDGSTMLAGYDGPEVSGPAEYLSGPAKRR